MTLPGNAVDFVRDRFNLDARVRVGVRDRVDQSPSLRLLIDSVLAVRAEIAGALSDGHSFAHVDRKYVQLGSLEYHLVGAVVGMESKQTYDFAEHAVVEGKPRLQFVGAGLDQVTLTLMLHTEYCDPDLEVLALETAAAAHEAMPLVWANGTVRGQYVIAELQQTIRQTDAVGRLVHAELRVALKEWVSDVVFEVATPARRAKRTAAVKPPAVSPAPAAVSRSLEEMLAEASRKKIPVHNGNSVTWHTVVAAVPTGTITRQP